MNSPSLRLMLRLGFASIAIGAAVLSCPSLTRTSHADVARDDEAVARVQIRQASDLSEGFKLAARVIRPSVVNVTALSRGQKASDLPEDERRFRRFFGMPDDNGQGTPTERGIGSGVIVDSEGFIVTNNHVIRGADDIRVRLHDGREFSAEVVGTDAETDIAVIRVDAETLVAASLGDSSALETGEWVLAVGTPFGLEQTVTAGIVSAVGRTDMGLATYENFIQTDAAINPGNSGGPLVNLSGEVVGINTAITTRSGGSMGIGFAVPSQMVENVVQQIKAHGRVERGWIGVSVQELDEHLARTFDFEGTEGVLISAVHEGPARSAGMRAGDIVTEINGTRVSETREMLNTLAEIRPGTEVPISIMREGRPRTVEVKLAARPAPEEVSRTASAVVTDSPLGARLRANDEVVAAELGLKTNEGVVILALRRGGLASRSGMLIGDVILEIDGAVVTTPEEVNQRLEVADLDQGLRIRVQRGGEQQFAVIRSK